MDGKITMSDEIRPPGFILVDGTLLDLVMRERYEGDERYPGQFMRVRYEGRNSDAHYCWSGPETWVMAQLERFNGRAPCPMEL